MKKVKFYYKGNGINSKMEEVVEFDDDTTDKEINEALENWLYQISDANWSYLEETQ